MAEVPPHLLDRAKARRAALSGGSVEAPAAAPAASSDAPGNAVAAAAAPAAAAPAAAPRAAKGGAPAKVEKPVTVPGRMFAKMGSVFLLVAVPVWGIFMFNSWATPRAGAETPASIGATLFTNNCVGCHLSNGAGSDGGGAGRPLYNGEVEKTFPDPVHQAAFIKHGSCTPGTPYGDPKRPGGQHVAKGGMPAFPNLSDAELLYLVNYERHILKSTPDAYPVNVLAKVGEDPTVAPATPFDPTTYKIDAAIKVCP